MFDNEKEQENVCIIKILDEVNIQLIGLDSNTRKKIVDKLKFFVPHAKYTPSYKMGYWDGTISFANIGGKTYLGLLDDILPIIISSGYEIKIDDTRKKYEFNFPKVDKDYLSEYTWNTEHQKSGNKIELRDYQVDAINSFLENPQCIQEIATGAGKCLDGDTKITVYVKKDSPFYNFLKKKNKL